MFNLFLLSIYISDSLEIPPCWKRVKANKARFGSNTPEDFVNPSCDKDGYFTPLQCRPLMGCYCVDKYGNPTTKPSRGRLPIGCRNFIQSTTSAPTTQVQPTEGNNALNIFQIVLDKARFLYNF